MNQRILIIEDDACLRETFRRFLSKNGYSVDTACEFQEAVTLISKTEYDVVFTDINLSGKETGVDFLAECKTRGITTPIVIITGFPTVNSAAEAVRQGGYDYLCKPVELDTLLHVTRGAIRHNSISREALRYRRNIEAIFQSVSDAMLSVDKHLTITDLNQSAVKFCVFSNTSVGQKLDHQEDDTHKNLCSEECRRRLIITVQESMTTGKPAAVYKYECPKHSSVYTLKVSPFKNGHNESNGAVIAISDETRISVLEKDLNRRRDFRKAIIGKSSPMQKIYSLIESLSDIRSTVLITGESGTGKELAAEALHFSGIRRDKPIVKVNCSALSESLLESELFGHIKGAFTGANNDRTGRFERADGGTLFLDEIGDISPSLQQKLLRVLQEKEFEKVGDSRPIKVDVRIIAATNRDLKDLVAQGIFREDLYYRLKVVEIRLPSLKDRKEDIPLLVDFFIGEFSSEFNKNIEDVSSDVMKLFMNYSWPGNTRELRHIIEHASIICRSSIITSGDLPDDFAKPSATEDSPKYAEKNNSDAEALLNAMKETRWNKAEAARILGISRQTLYRKLKEARIE